MKPHKSKKWKLAKRLLSWLFLTVTLALIIFYAQKIDWKEVWQVLRNYDRRALWAAAGLTALSYLIYGGYDLLARVQYHHRLEKRQVMLVAFICYAFNLTLSTWVGGIGMRYRLYSQLGLSKGMITRIFSLSISTNWLGYILLGGVLFTSAMVPLPSHWYLSESTLQLLGGVLLAIIIGYIWCCARAKKRHITLFKQRFELPAWRFALLQLTLSSVNWMIMAAIIWLLTDQQVNYFLLLGVLLVSSIAGVIIHIPAGIGVLEAVFIALLATEPVSKGNLIAALLAYRTLYFFIPLFLAALCYLWMEHRARQSAVGNQSAPKSMAPRMHHTPERQRGADTGPR
ncbi:YbhN family protein [Erwinia sp. HR93]|uniref:lysylphosphatidylglycerol synthase transmembrane domain-containing protein n=1 Tax=Erwinia sp. HR93 TaxID=3094840 RepID=UPI002ADEBBA3|nr:YbhN family protein [Erwinia sp. HR93]MEA1064501.1 YbhN family protein [Erwinia sp. HR93]